MTATGLEVFDKTLQITNTWLDELTGELGPQRNVAWHALGAVLRTLRDRLTIELGAHVSAQLPLIVRGVWYDQFQPARLPERYRTAEEFLARVSDELSGTRPVDVTRAARSVLALLGRHVTPELVAKTKDALPEPVRALWPAPGAVPLGRGAAADNGRARGETAMRVSQAMTRDVHLARPDESIRDAAREMAEIDAGVLPVADGDRLIGMITDRDIAIRAVAEGKSPDTKVREVMSVEVKYCFEDEDLERVMSNIGDLRVRRLPVMNRDKRLVGIVSLGDIATKQQSRKAAQALGAVSQPGGPHSQREELRH